MVLIEEGILHATDKRMVWLPERNETIHRLLRIHIRVYT